MEHQHSNKLYYVIYLVLLVLLIFTVWVAYLDLGTMALACAVTIATIKAALVLAYFMHVADRTPLVWMFATGGFAWLVIMLAFTFSDYWTRNWELPTGPNAVEAAEVQSGAPSGDQTTAKSS